MKAVVCYLLLFGYFVYLVAPDTSQVRVIPLSESCFNVNTTPVVTEVKKALASDDIVKGLIANSRMIIHCFVDEDINTDIESASCSASEEHLQNFSRATDDCTCQLFLIEGLPSGEISADIASTNSNSPDSGFSPWSIDMNVVSAYWNTFTTLWIYAIIVMFVIRIYEDWRPSSTRPRHDVVVSEDSFVYNTEDASSSDLITTSSVSSEGYYDCEHAGVDDACKPRLDGLQGQSDLPDSRVSGNSCKLESEVEISELEKLLASGSAVIVRGISCLPWTEKKVKPETTDSSVSSYIHDIGDGFADIYRDTKPRQLFTASSPNSIQRPYNPIFSTSRPSVLDECWLRTQSLPNIHQKFYSNEFHEDAATTAVKTQVEQYGSEARRCGSTQAHQEKEPIHDSSTVNDTAPAVNAESGQCNSDIRCSSLPLLYASDTRYDCRRFCKSMDNVAALSDNSCEELCRSSPCIPSSCLSSSVSTDGLAGDDSIPQDAEILAGRGLDPIQGEANNADCYECYGCNEVIESSQCIDKPESVWNNLKEETHRQVVVPFMLYAAKVMLVEFAFNL